MKNLKNGWIGTGVMGKSMVQHLIKSNYSTIIYNRTKNKASELVNLGAIWAENPKIVASKANIIFTIVGYPNDVEQVYFGKNGIFEGLEEGKICIDMTTTKPSLAKKIYENARKLNAHFIDAPVSGGDVGAKNGTLSIMAGGDKNIFEKIKPILEIFGSNIIYQGKAGSGQHTKMCNQIVIAGTMVGVCESLLYGYKAGLDLTTMLNSISKGAAGCWTLNNLAPRIINRDFEPGFFVEHFIKDMEIAIEEAKRMQITLPGLNLVHQLYFSVQNLGFEKKGTQALILVIEKMAKSSNT